ncbi:conserved oligomeric Golgi complex subunit 3 [Tachypleus tridentatus]|uniref:conserved oligomeric Golgi complex subunit 3 n=1 Tax=Tachypleus tridentatus TaxID=6853 RepID=UPI003FD3D200
MAGSLTSEMKVVLERLNDWERDIDPLAPITALQKESIEELMSVVAARPLPREVDIERISPLESEYELEKERNNSEVLCLSSALADFQAEATIETSQQFLSLVDNIEERILKDDNEAMKLYVDQLYTSNIESSSLFDEITTSLEQLESLQKLYIFVSDKTNTLHEACEQLLADQATLVNCVEVIKEKLSYFNELETLSQKLNSPTLSVVSESFVPMLARLDDCIAYLKANPQYKESETYLARFKRLLAQALGMIRSYVMANLQQTTQQILVYKDTLSPSDNAFTLLYGKFRTRGPRIRALMEQIEERVEKNSEYQQLLEDCYQCYFTQRELLLGPGVSTAITNLAEKHKRDHCALMRSGCAFLVHLSEDEHQLYRHFFSLPSQELNNFLERLCQRLYDVLRTIIIHINHLETLTELCTILKVEMLEEFVQNDPKHLEAFASVAQQMLEDVQERLAYRTHIYIRTDILNYHPAPGDLAYPEKLEMMQNIAESLAQKPLSRSSSRSSLGSSTSAPACVSSEPKNREESSAVTSGSVSKQGMESTMSQSASELNPSISVKGRTVLYSPADLHGMWYPTVRRTLVCLSKLYRCLEKTIFQGLSQEVLSMCILSLVSASQSIAKNKTTLDAHLFQIKHLLILREQISPFQIDFTIKETALDFSRVKSAAVGLLQKKSKLFSLSSNNALLEFLLEGTPQVTENLVDSKKAVDNQLKIVCEEFIANTVEMLIGQLLIFLNKAKVILQVGEKETTRQVVLKNQPWASAEKVSELVNEAYKHLKTKLPSLANSMSLYLANRDTEHILFRPIRNRVQTAFEQLLQLVRTNYSEDEQLIIGCPSTDQISLLLSSAIIR